MPVRQLPTLSFGLALLVTASCSGGGGSGMDGGGMDSGGGGGGGVGDPCGSDTDCRAGLICDAGTCQAAGVGGIGAPCTLTAECIMDLYCDDNRSCARAGTGRDFAPCTTTADCAHDYVCVPQPTGGDRCVLAGDLDLDAPCERQEQCLAGLYCDDGMCVATAPFVTPDAAPPDGGGLDSMVGEPCMRAPDGGWPDGGGPCDDMSTCTIDSCSGGMMMTCVHTLQDPDLDGYASTLFGACGRDCNDDDATVNPDHTAFESTRHSGDPPLEPSNFDWNCDRIEEREFTGTVPDCDSGLGTCTVGEGWAGIPPMCGQTGTWQRCTGPAAGCSIVTVETRTQRCR